MKKLAFTFLFLSIYCLGFAQDSYKYAVVTFTPFHQKLSIFKDGVADERNKVKGSSPYDITPLLAEVEKLSSESWEVYSSNAGGIAASTDVTYYYFLRRKK